MLGSEYAGSDPQMTGLWVSVIVRGSRTLFGKGVDHFVSAVSQGDRTPLHLLWRWLARNGTKWEVSQLGMMVLSLDPREGVGFGACTEDYLTLLFHPGVLGVKGV